MKLNYEIRDILVSSGEKIVDNFSMFLEGAIKAI
jgi:hypothetical protein